MSQRTGSLKQSSTRLPLLVTGVAQARGSLMPVVLTLSVCVEDQHPSEVADLANGPVELPGRHSVPSGAIW